MKDFLKQSAKLTQHTTYNLQLTFSDEIELGLVSFVHHPGQGGDVRDLALSVSLEEHVGCHRHPLLPSHWSLVGSQG